MKVFNRANISQDRKKCQASTKDEKDWNKNLEAYKKIKKKHSSCLDVHSSKNLQNEHLSCETNLLNFNLKSIHFL